MIGRPYLWGLAVGGEVGVVAVVRQLRSELERTMALIGRTILTRIDQSVLAPAAF